MLPLALFVYDRPEHTRRTLGALKNNTLAGESHLHIFADGPKADAPFTQKQRILRVRSLLEEFDWPGKITICLQEKNQGLAPSVIRGVTELTERYGQVVVLEDDLITSPYFLEFMRDALAHYAENEKVYGVTGFTYPAQYPENLADTFFFPVVCSWGWGTWKRAWQRFRPDAQALAEEIEQKGLRKKYNFGSYYFMEILEATARGEASSWAARFNATTFLEGGLFLYPKKSLVQNIGFDLSGEHCDEEDFFSRVKAHDFLPKVEAQEVKPLPEVEKALEKSFQREFGLPPLPVRVLNKLKRMAGLKK